MTARQYFVSGIGGFGAARRDLIFLGDASLALRIYQRHAIDFTYQLARRSSDLQALPDQTRARSTVGVFYTFLGSGGFGAVRTHSCRVTRAIRRISFGVRSSTGSLIGGDRFGGRVADVSSLDDEDDVFGDARGVVANALEVT